MTETQQNEQIDLIPTSALVLHYADIKCFDSDVIHPLPRLYQYQELIRQVVAEQCATFADPKSLWMQLPSEVMDCFKNRIKERKYHFMTAIEDELRQPDDKRPEQVVLIANGYNPMAVALAEKYPDVNFYVTDRSEKACVWNTNVYKRLGLDNLMVVESDCARDDLILVLQDFTAMDYAPDRVFNPAKKTLFALEGIVYYIEQADEETLVKQALSIESPRNVVLLDFQDRDVLDRAETYEYEGDSTPLHHKLMIDTIAKVVGCAPLRLSSFGQIYNYIRAHFLDNHPKLIDINLLHLTDYQYFRLSQLDPAFDLESSHNAKGCRIAKIISVPKEQ